MTLIKAIACILLMQIAPAAPQAAKASIEGTVVDARNGLALPGVRVILSRVAPTQAPPGSVPSPLSAAPPPPPPPPPPPAAGAGGVAGGGFTTSTFVIQSVGGAPPTPPGTNLPSATTDSQGHYVLKDVDAGVFRVTFAMNGY